MRANKEEDNGHPEHLLKHEEGPKISILIAPLSDLCHFLRSVNPFCLLNCKPQTKCMPPSLQVALLGPPACKDVLRMGPQACRAPTAVGVNLFATFGLDVQFLGLVGKYLDGRGAVFPHELRLKLEGVCWREGSFLSPLCGAWKGKVGQPVKG